MKINKKFLIYYFTLINIVESIQIKCDFRLNSEECKVVSLKVLENDTEVTSIVGTHAFRKTNRDVKEIWIDRGVESEFIPTNICKFFENIERMDLYGSQIKHVSRLAFKNCPKVSKVCILFTSLWSLPEDLFEDLIELKELFLYDNKLLFLPEKLIAKNTKLTSFSAKSNQLITVDIDFKPITASIDLRGNKCIDKRFPEDIKTLTLFKKELEGNCESSFKKSFAIKFQETSDLQRNLTEKIDHLVNEKLELEIEKKSLTLNVSQLLEENSMLRDEVALRHVEIEAIKINNTKEVAAVFDENILLKINVSECQRTLDKSFKEAKEQMDKNLVYIEKIETFQIDLKALKVNQTLSDRKTANLLSKLELLEASNSNFNESLEECWQNLSSVNAFNEALNLQILDISKNFTNEINGRGDRPLAENKSDNCVKNICLKYFIILFLTFITILVAIVVFMRRRASRMLIRQMVNHQVSMGRLID